MTLWKSRNLAGRISTDREDVLEHRLRSVRKGDYGVAVLSHNGQASLWIHINKDVAYLHFLPNDTGATSWFSARWYVARELRKGGSVSPDRRGRGGFDDHALLVIGPCDSRLQSSQRVSARPDTPAVGLVERTMNNQHNKLAFTPCTDRPPNKDRPLSGLRRTPASKWRKVLLSTRQLQALVQTQAHPHTTGGLGCFVVGSTAALTLTLSRRERGPCRPHPDPFPRGEGTKLRTQSYSAS